MAPTMFSMARALYVMLKNTCVFAQFCQKNLYLLYDLYMLYILRNKFERKKKKILEK